MNNDYSLLRPFDLEAAKADKPICTRDGRVARFIAHVPECDDEHRVIAHIENASWSNSFRESGRIAHAVGETRADLRMAPLGWVEGRPVYSGDILYFTDVEGSGEVYGVNDKNQLLIRSSKFGCVHQEADKLTWTPPTVKREGWVNVYHNTNRWRRQVTAGEVYPSKEAADANAIAARRIACIRIEWEEPAGESK